MKKTARITSEVNNLKFDGLKAKTDYKIYSYGRDDITTKKFTP